MIRQAKISDIPRIVEMLVNFYNAGPFEGEGLTWDLFSITSYIRRMIDNYKSNIVIVLEKEKQIVGTLGAYKGAWMGNKDQFQIVEHFFWIEPDHRGFGAAKQLLKSLESASEQCGAVGLKLASIETKDQDRIGKFYEYLGYKPADKLYRKRLHNARCSS